MGNPSYNVNLLNVLVVDDHDPIRKGMRRVLNSMGIESITECFDGKDALEHLAKKPYDLVLCDIYMKEVDGFQVLQRIRDRTVRSDIPFFIVTGEGSKQDIVQASDLGATDYILKPFQADDIESKIHKALHAYFSPPPLLSLLRRGDAALEEKDLKAATDAFRAALHLDAKSLRAKHSLAHTLFKGEEHEEAIKLLKEILRVSNTFYKSYRTLANIYLAQGKHPEAIDAMIKELKLNSKQPERHNTLAKLLYKSGKLGQSIEYYREALKIQPKNAKSLLGIGFAFAADKNLDKALYYFKRLRRYYPKDTKSLNAIVSTCIKANEVKKGQLVLADIRRTQPDNLDTYVTLAKLYLRQNEVDKAAEIVEKMKGKENAESVESFRLGADVLMKKGNFKEAEVRLNHVVSSKPDIESYRKLGICQSKLGRFQDATLTLKKAILLSGNKPRGNLFFRLADAYFATGQFTKAFGCYLRASNLGINKEKILPKLQECNIQVQKRRGLRPSIQSAS